MRAPPSVLLAGLLLTALLSPVGAAGPTDVLDRVDRPLPGSDPIRVCVSMNPPPTPPTVQAAGACGPRFAEASIEKNGSEIIIRVYLPGMGCEARFGCVYVVVRRS